jgi:hypothetical protein
MERASQEDVQVQLVGIVIPSVFVVLVTNQIFFMMGEYNSDNTKRELELLALDFSPELFGFHVVSLRIAI